MATQGVIVRDLGFNRIMGKFARMKGQAVQVGVFEGPAVEYAALHVFGTEHMPARDFMAQAERRHRVNIAARKAEIASRVLFGNLTPARAMYFLGVRYQALMRETIREAVQWAVPLAPSTVLKKGHSRPLYETGTLIQAIDYRAIVVRL